MKQGGMEKLKEKKQFFFLYITQSTSKNNYNSTS